MNLPAIVNYDLVEKRVQEVDGILRGGIRKLDAMNTRLAKRPSKSMVDRAAFPPGRVGYAIGDIHGRDDLLQPLLDSIELDARNARDPVVIFLGDYMDRGPQSKAALDRAMAWAPPFERRYLLGNHEQMLLNFLEDPTAGSAWLKHGGLDTLVSFGVRPPKVEAAEERARAADEMRTALGPDRLAFLQSLELYVIFGDYFFVHAGVNDKKPLDEQAPADLIWSRSSFISSKRRWSHVVVHGHTPSETPFQDHRRIGIDTGAYATGRLSAVRLEGEKIVFLEGRPVKRRSSRTQ